MLFHDRRDAGQRLGERLREVKEAGRLGCPVVLALPRGGALVADEVARALHAPLDVLLARRIGAPFNPELGVGALAGEDPPLYDERALALLDLTPDQLSPEVARERNELHRREYLYRRGRPPSDVRDRAVVVVDDGLATGVTARAALRTLRRRRPGRIVLAVPVCSQEAATVVDPEVDEVVCLHHPEAFRSVGEWYEDFRQVTDEEVIGIVRGALAPR
ncbi:phosphoribosyltransferase family protein [Streptomyces sp. B1866]|uniref:phosphoribosyltransferase n=1 Tax=Streptomyces sp. B1866 TaxID=3075431 RepID=UPI00288F5970|nr:phosphoribosyltransferase family protein [Streptomyces sp. B1866]MDT3397123.1 phosphoribosyltransferase family protein [Streptomyces sp. B1866]